MNEQLGPYRVVAKSNRLVIEADEEKLSALYPRLRRLLGPSVGTAAMLALVQKRGELRAWEAASELKLKIANASNKLRQLAERGYLEREEVCAPTGGTEFVYRPCGERR